MFLPFTWHDTAAAAAIWLCN